MGFCPECHAEYVPAIARCPECSVDLVEALPASLEVSEELVPVYAVTELLEANLVKETLAAEGIEAMVSSHEDRAFPTHGAQSGHHVLVLLSQRERALELVRSGLANHLFGAFGQIVTTVNDR